MGPIEWRPSRRSAPACVRPRDDSRAGSGDFVSGRGIVGACAISLARSSPCSCRSPSASWPCRQRLPTQRPRPSPAPGSTASGPWRRTPSCGRVTARPPYAPCSAHSTTSGVGPVVVDGYYGPQTKAAVKEITDGFEGTGAPHPYRITGLLGASLRPPAARQQPRDWRARSDRERRTARSGRPAGTSSSTATSAPRPGGARRRPTRRSTTSGPPTASSTRTRGSSSAWVGCSAN